MKAKKNLKKYEDMWSKIKDITRLTTKNSDGYNEQHLKNKYNSDHELPLNKTIEITSMIIVVRAVFMKIANIIHKFS